MFPQHLWDCPKVPPPPPKKINTTTTIIWWTSKVLGHYTIYSFSISLLYVNNKHLFCLFVFCRMWHLKLSELLIYYHQHSKVKTMKESWPLMISFNQGINQTELLFTQNYIVSQSKLIFLLLELCLLEIVDSWPADWRTHCFKCSSHFQW